MKNIVRNDLKQKWTWYDNINEDTLTFMESPKSNLYPTQICTEM